MSIDTGIVVDRLDASEISGQKQPYEEEVVDFQEVNLSIADHLPRRRGQNELFDTD